MTQLTAASETQGRRTNVAGPSSEKTNLMLEGVIYRFTYSQPWKLSACTAVRSDSGGFEQAGSTEKGSG